MSAPVADCPFKVKDPGHRPEVSPNHKIWFALRAFKFDLDVTRISTVFHKLIRSVARPRI